MLLFSLNIIYRCLLMADNNILKIKSPMGGQGWDYLSGPPSELQQGEEEGVTSPFTLGGLSLSMLGLRCLGSH